MRHPIPQGFVLLDQLRVARRRNLLISSQMDAPAIMLVAAPPIMVPRTSVKMILTGSENEE